MNKYVTNVNRSSRNADSKWFSLPHFLTSERPIIWLAPATILMLVFGIYPLVSAISWSLYRKNAATRAMQFNPSYNWIKAFEDERLWGALFNTMVYSISALVIQLVLGMLIALLLDTDRKGYGLMRALLTLPLVVPPAVTGMMFLLMLNGSFGVISRGLVDIGIIPTGFPILGNASTALGGVLLAEIWQWTPFMVLIMLAGLRSLPKEPFEAAAIDGATPIQAFFKLTLPMMSKVIAIAVVIRGVDLLRAFDYVKVMTDSGPGTATETLSSYAGRIYFGGSSDGPYTATISLITLIIIVILSNIFMKIAKVKL